MSMGQEIAVACMQQWRVKAGPASIDPTSTQQSHLVPGSASCAPQPHADYHDIFYYYYCWSAGARQHLRCMEPWSQHVLYRLVSLLCLHAKAGRAAVGKKEPINYGSHTVKSHKLYPYTMRTCFFTHAFPACALHVPLIRAAEIACKGDFCSPRP